MVAKPFTTNQSDGVIDAILEKPVADTQHATFWFLYPIDVG
jgi:hypothetical protein